MLAIALALLVTPSALSGPLWVVATVQDNAGNSTGLLLFSSLIALVWLQNPRSLLGPFVIAVLGFVAGWGFLG